MQFQYTFGKLIESRRKNLKLSQTKLGKLMGYKSAAIVSHWEKGDYFPTPKALKHLAHVLQMDVKDLLILYIQSKLDSEKQKIIGEFYADNT